jgi:hypothetical protein
LSSSCQHLALDEGQSDTAEKEKEEGEYDVENQELEVLAGFQQNTVYHLSITSGEVEQVLLTLLQSLMELAFLLRKSPGKKQAGTKGKSQQKVNEKQEQDLPSSVSSSSSLALPSKFTRSAFVTTSRFQPATAWKTAKLLEYMEIEEQGLVDTKLSVLALVYSIQHLSRETKEIWTVFLELLILKFNQLQTLYG